MPLVRNNGTQVKFLGDIPVYPNETKIVYHYPEKDDTLMEVLSDYPKWNMGMTGPEKREAITTVKVYQIPKGTNNICITNVSSGNIIFYGQEKGETSDPEFIDLGISIGPSSVKTMPNILNRFWQIELYGTSAENEVIVTFLE